MNNRELIVRVVLLTLALYAAVSLIAAQNKLAQAQTETLLLEQRCREEQARNSELQGMLDEGINDELVQTIARDRLGLVMPGEVIFYFSTDREG